MKTISIAILLFLFHSPVEKESADLIIHNATIYTVDERFAVAEAMAVKGGKILATGSSKQILETYQSLEKIDAKGKAIFPGFIDAHAHFGNYGLQLQTVDLSATSSWEECLERIRDFVKSNQIKSGEWIVGRGWDQNDWNEKEFPSRELLDKAYPLNPVYLTRVDGHAAIVNAKAIEISKIKAGMQLTGGELISENGTLTGVLIDNATRLVSSRIPAPGTAAIEEAYMDAQANCFAKGLTTVDDCGVSFWSVETMDKLHKSGKLKMKVYAMLSDQAANYNYIRKKGIIKTDRLHVRSFKVYADGALGSRGACLLEPYSDKPDSRGFLLSQISHFDSVANLLMEQNLQMCTHAIGDSGNRVILNIYGKYLKTKNDRRWRIEHAQVVSEKDFSLFGDYSVIPSVQPTHATSDMYWAGTRLGAEREKGAYAFKRLMNQNGWIPLGTDFPVEDIDPLKTFYAAFARKDSKAWPEGGYQPENALSREEAIRGMTIWAAKSNFEENEKGSLEKGKAADFIILDRDIMKIAEKEILGTTVLLTYINGEKVYSNQ